LWKKLLPWAVSVLFLALALLGRRSAPPSDVALSLFDVPLLPGQSLTHNFRHGLDVSLDGRRIAFIANPIGSPPRRIYVRNLNQPDVVALAGTEGAQNPFFSPDGQYVGFLIGHQIRKAALAGGVPTVIADDVGTSLGVDWGPLGITWGENGDIVFPMGLGTGLSVVRETGGERKVFTDLDPKNNEVSHRLPHFLPDGSGVLFTVLRYSNITPDWKRSQVWLKSLKTGERKLLIENALDARYSGSGSLIFAREGKLYAIRFDPKAQTVSGSPVLVLGGVVQSMYGTAGVQWTGAAQYSVSETGALFYAPGSIEPPDLTTIVSVNRQGMETPIQGVKPRSQLYVRVAPDGKRIAFSELYVDKDLWVFDTTRGTEDRQTYEGQNAAPIWSPDGSFLAFRSDRAGPLGLYLTKGLNTREVTMLTSGPNDTPSSWTPDGKQLLFTRGAGSMATIGSGTDIYAVSIDHPNDVKPVVATDADERFPELSPDGKWLAYCSNETGGFQIYVQPYPGKGKRVTLTSDGGQEPAWSRDGSNQLFYINRGKMMSIHYTVSGSEFVPETAVPLFDSRFRGAGATIRIAYDVGPDGRFFGVVPAPDVADDRQRKIAPSTLRFVLNWNSEVDRLLGK
jgi:serine/threonine-protein kinase